MTMAVRSAAYARPTGATADPFADTALLPATMNEPHHDRR